MPLQEAGRQQEGRAGHREEQPSAGSTAGDSGDSYGRPSGLWEGTSGEKTAGKRPTGRQSVIKVWRKKGYLSNREGCLQTIQSKCPAQSKGQPEQDAQSQILHL